MLETRSRKAHPIQEEMTRWILVRSAKATARASMAKAEGSKGSKHSKARTARQAIECWNCVPGRHYLKDCWSETDQTNRGGSKGKNKNKHATYALNLDPTKTANKEP